MNQTTDRSTFQQPFVTGSIEQAKDSLRYGSKQHSHRSLKEKGLLSDKRVGHSIRQSDLHPYGNMLSRPEDRFNNYKTESTYSNSTKRLLATNESKDFVNINDYLKKEKISTHQIAILKKNVT